MFNSLSLELSEITNSKSNNIRSEDTPLSRTAISDSEYGANMEDVREERKSSSPDGDDDFVRMRRKSLTWLRLLSSMRYLEARSELEMLCHLGKKLLVATRTTIVSIKLSAKDGSRTDDMEQDPWITTPPSSIICGNAKSVVEGLCRASGISSTEKSGNYQKFRY